MEPIISKKVCIDCKEEYESRTFNVLGSKLTMDKGRCQKCARIKREEADRKELEQEQFVRNSKREEWRKSCGIPLKFQKERFDTYKPLNVSLRAALDDCKDFTDKFPPYSNGYRSLYLYSDGVWGVGKSHLACSMVHDILDKWDGTRQVCPVYYVSEPLLFRRIKSTFNKHEGYQAETEDDIYRQLTTIPLLVIDDMGKEEVSDSRFVQRTLFTIIDGRYNNMLPMVITANKTPEKLEQHLGGDKGNCASFERLMEMTGNNFRELTGKTYRDLRNRGESK